LELLLSSELESLEEEESELESLEEESELESLEGEESPPL